MPRSRVGFGEKIAFTDSDRSLSYGELQARSCRFASALQKLGLRPEERLGLLLYDTVDFPVAFWGGVRAGIVVLPLNTLLNAEQYAYILGDSRTATVVASASLAKTLVPVLDRLPHLRTIILVGADPDDKAAVPRPRRVRVRRSPGARRARSVRGADAVRRSRVLDVHVRFDRRSQGRQAYPHHADGGGAADGPARHRYPRRRRRVLRGEIVFLLRHGQRHGVPAVGRRHHCAVAATADVGGSVRHHAPTSADNLLRRTDALCLVACAQGYDSRRRLRPLAAVRFRRRSAARPSRQALARRGGRRRARRHRLDRDVPDLSVEPAGRRALRHDRKAGAGLRPEDRR